jgi:hypothetical protein
MEGSGGALIWGTIQALPGATKENYETCQDS